MVFFFDWVRTDVWAAHSATEGWFDSTLTTQIFPLFRWGRRPWFDGMGEDGIFVIPPWDSLMEIRGVWMEHSVVDGKWASVPVRHDLPTLGGF